MARTGLLLTLFVGVVFGAVLAFYPQLDLVAAQFASASTDRPGFVTDTLIYALRDGNVKISVGLAMLAAGAMLVRLIFKDAPMLIPARAVMLIVLTYLLGPGLIANVILKDHWSRPRPGQVTQFGGPHSFKPWWDPRGDCPRNCSFVSGEAAAAFATLSVAAVIPGVMGGVAIAGALLYGLAIGAIRMMAGAHFASDIAMAGVMIALLVWLLHGLIYRWPATRITEEQAKAGLDGIGQWLRGGAAASRLRSTGKPI